MGILLKDGISNATEDCSSEISSLDYNNSPANKRIRFKSGSDNQDIVTSSESDDDEVLESDIRDQSSVVFLRNAQNQGSLCLIISLEIKIIWTFPK